jgi:hypothetical protein
MGHEPVVPDKLNSFLEHVSDLPLKVLVAAEHERRDGKVAVRVKEVVVALV